MRDAARAGPSEALTSRHLIRLTAYASLTPLQPLDNLIVYTMHDRAEVRVGGLCYAEAVDDGRIAGKAVCEHSLFHDNLW